MAVQGEKQTKAPGREQNVRPEEQFVPEQAAFGLPNSFLAAAPLPPPPGTPNSVMREMLTDRQIPEAEDEADRLSAGIRYGTPDSVRQQMGHRLGADFSSVRFHSNSESIHRNESLGARAYTRGSDVFFGRGGFDPSVAAHELVHTVQQQAVPGHVSQSVSFGAVQMKKKFWAGKLVDQVKASESPEPEEEQKRNIAAHGRPVKLGLWQRFRNFLHRHSPFAKRRRRSHDHLLDEEPSAAAAPSGSPDLTAAAVSPEPEDDGTKKASEGDAEPKSEGVLGLPLAAEPNAKLKIDENDDDDGAVPFDDWLNEREPEEAPEPAVPKAEVPATHVITDEEDDGSSTGSETTEEDRSEADEEDDKKNERLQITGQNEIRIFWENKIYDISVEDGDMRILEQQIGGPEEEGSEDEGPALLSVVIGENNDVSIVFDTFNISGQVIKETAQEEPDELSKKDDDSIADSDDDDDEEEEEEEEDENDPLIDRQVQAYIRAHNAMVQQGMGHDKGRVSTGGAMGKAKQAADLLGAGKSVSSLITEGDRVRDALRHTGLGAKHSSRDFVVKHEPVLNAQTNLIGTGAALISTATNAVDTVNNAKKVTQGANPVEAVASGTKTLTSVADAGASGVKFLASVGASGVTPALDFVPFVQAGSGAFNSIVGFGGGIRHRYHLHKVHEQQRELERRMNSGIPAAADAEGPEAEDEMPPIVSVDDPAEDVPNPMEEDEEEPVIRHADDDEEEARPADGRSPEQKEADRRHMMRILRQMEMVEERKRTGGTVQGTQGLVAFGGGLAAGLAGPLMPVASAAIGGASAGLALGRFAYDKKKKSMTREQVISEDLGIDWKREIAIVRRSVPYGKYLPPIRVRKIILKAYGFQKGTRHEAYAYLTQQRANFMWDQMNSGNEDADIAENAFNAVGVHRRKGRYQEGAKQLLAQYMM